MPSPTKREEREKQEAAERAKQPKPAPPPQKPATTVGGVVDALKERKKLLDET